MEKHKKKIAEAPDGMEYIWVVDLGLRTGYNYNDGGLIKENKLGASDYQYYEHRMVRTRKLHTYEGRRCIFVDMSVFEVKR